jgi:glycosyltransferase involved in cell wall biosynthesis
MGHVLWMINHYASLPEESGGTRHFWLSKGLQQLGWDVRLVRSAPAGQGTHRSRLDVIDGLQVTSVHGSAAQTRGIARVAGWGVFTALLQYPGTTAHLPRPDVVLGSSVHLGASWVARRLARRHGADFVFEVRDLWPETLIAMGALKRTSVLATMMLRLERSLARSAALVVSPLSGVGGYMHERHGVPSERFVWIPNGVHTENYRATPDPAPGPLRLQYFGAVGRANHVDILVDAVARANATLDQPVQLQICGAGPLLPALESRVAADARLASAITFLPPVPAKEVAERMAWGNGLVMVVGDLPELYRYGISMNKLFDYLAGGRWIIMGTPCTDNPIGRAPGLTTVAPTVESLSSAIVDVARMSPLERDRRAAGNLTLAKDRFDYSVLAAQLSDALSKLPRTRALPRQP